MRLIFFGSIIYYCSLGMGFTQENLELYSCNNALKPINTSSLYRRLNEEGSSLQYMMFPELQANAKVLLNRLNEIEKKWMLFTARSEISPLEYFSFFRNAKYQLKAAISRPTLKTYNRACALFMFIISPYYLGLKDFEKFSSYCIGEHFDRFSKLGELKQVGNLSNTAHPLLVFVPQNQLDTKENFLRILAEDVIPIGIQDKPSGGSSDADMTPFGHMKQALFHTPILMRLTNKIDRGKARRIFMKKLLQRIDSETDLNLRKQVIQTWFDLLHGGLDSGFSQMQFDKNRIKRAWLPSWRRIPTVSKYVATPEVRDWIVHFIESP